MLGDVPAEGLLFHEVAQTGLNDRKRWINPDFLSCQNLFLHLQNLVGEEESKVSGKYAVLHVSQNLSGRQHVTDNDNDL